MSAAGLGLLLACVLAIGLAFLNGLHDASNAVATTIATRALSERTALRVAALLNLLGALLGLGLARADLSSVAYGGLDVFAFAPPTSQYRGFVISALVGTIGWSLLTWWRGMPSSTWHAASGAVAGAAVGGVGIVTAWHMQPVGIVLASLLAPVVGAILAFALTLLAGRLTAGGRLGNRSARAAQTVSAAAIAVGHGLRDIALPLAALTLASFAWSSGDGTAAVVPAWTDVLVAFALGAGTLVGGRRIIRTLATRLTDLSTAQGLAAETSAAAILYASMLAGGLPVSTTHTVTAGIVGSGVAVGPRAVRWPMAGRIALTWVLTPLGAGVIAAVCALLLRHL